MSGWQPIETAPKDGTKIILYGNHWGDEVEAQQGYWINGWTINGERGMYSAEPTHWMPLPTPPESND